jgi:hypothetical protein
MSKELVGDEPDLAGGFNILVPNRFSYVMYILLPYDT